MTTPKIYTIPFSKVYPLYIQKVQKKGRTQEEVDEIISWLTGYSKEGLNEQLSSQVDFKTFIIQAPHLHPNRKYITGVICGIRVENIEDNVTQEIRYIDKLIDELAKGKSMKDILRSSV